MPYFDEPFGRVKIQRTSKNSYFYFTSAEIYAGILQILHRSRLDRFESVFFYKIINNKSLPLDSLSETLYFTAVLFVFQIYLSL